MSFFVDVVVGGEPSREFSVGISVISLKVRHFKAFFESTTSGKEIGFAAATWGVFLADSDGRKTGGELANDNVITEGMKVWVERLHAPGAYSHKLAASFAFSRLNN